MNKGVILTGTLVFFTIVLAATSKTDWQEANLIGKVKVLKSDYETTTYNASGYIESVIKGNENWYDGDTIYTYDASNRLITVISHDSDKKEMCRFTETYDANGLLIKEVRKDYSEVTDKLEYNAKKQLVWKKTYYEDDSLTSASEFTYDSTGNKISQKDYDEEMELYYKTIFTYDKGNKLVEKKGFKVWDTDILDETCKYDTDGFQIENIAYYRGEIESKYNYYYDKYHNVTNKEIFEMGRSISYSYIYTYDKLGNWLTKEEYCNGKLNNTIKREITYY